MSTKSTIFLTPCCHIYRDVEYTEAGEIEKLCIDVSYLTVGDYYSIEVLWKSDFAEMIRFLFDTIDHDELDRVCRDYWAKNLK